MTDFAGSARRRGPLPPERAAGRSTTDWFWSELARLADRWSAREHRFYAHWSSGTLLSEDLARYAEERDPLIASLAAISRTACDKAPPGLLHDILAMRADEAERHGELWRVFAAHSGWDRRTAWHYAYDPHPETVACAALWEGETDRPLAVDLATLCATDLSLPDLAAVEYQGLTLHYGFGSGGPETAYFRDRAAGDAEPALLRAALTGLLGGDDPFALLAHAEAVHRAQWTMLDGLERGRGR